MRFNIKALSVFALCACVVTLSIPVVVSKAAPEVNTITEYVDTDGDGYIDVDSVYNGCPVISQEVTDEGIIITQFDIPQTFGLTERDWYYDYIIIDYTATTGFDHIIDGPFQGQFTITIPQSSQTQYVYVYFFNDFIESSCFDYSSFDFEHEINVYSENIGTFQIRDFQFNVSNELAGNSKTYTLVDHIYTFTDKHTYNALNTGYIRLMHQLTLQSNTSTDVNVDIVASCDLDLYSESGLEVEVDSTITG